MTVAKVAPPLAAIMALTELIEKSSGAILLAYVTASSSWWGALKLALCSNSPVSWIGAPSSLLTAFRTR